MQVLRDPDRDTALRFLQEELAGLAQRRGHLVQAMGKCEVRYQGRARSLLSHGERLVILKPDGTLLIHTATKAKPVNWQPPGATFSVSLSEGRLVLASYRLKPEEIVRITFEKVAMLLSMPLRDGAELSLVGSEGDLQRLLFEQPHLVEDGFVPRRRERDSERGFYDLDGDDAAGRRLVVEVKRGTAGVSEAQQLWRYVERLRRANQSVRGVLMAPAIAPKARSLLSEVGLEWKELDWAEVMPKVEAIRSGGQSSLARYR
jgi:RecB family endonuclease NucS